MRAGSPQILLLAVAVSCTGCVHRLDRSFADLGQDAPRSDASAEAGEAARPDAGGCTGPTSCRAGSHCCGGACTAGPCVATLAGSGLVGAPDAPLKSAHINGVVGMLGDGKGNLLFTEWSGAGCALRLLNAGTQAIGPVPGGSIGRLAGGRLGCRPGAALAAELSGPTAIARDAAGNVYIADPACAVIWKLSSDHSTVSILAGERGRREVRDGSGSSAWFHAPQGLAYSKLDGNLYVSEYGANLIRRVSLNGQVTTIAGSGAEGTVDGLATQAQFRTPAGLTVDSAGNLMVAQWEGAAIRKVTGPATAAPLVATIVPESKGYSAGLNTLSITSSDSLLSQLWGHGLRRNIPPGYLGEILLAFDGRLAEHYDPASVPTVWLGGWVFNGAANNTIARFDLASKAVSPVAGTPGVFGAADGPAASATFTFASGGGIAVDAAGAVWIADMYGLRARRISTAGVVDSFGSGAYGEQGGTATTAAMRFPCAIAAAGSDAYVVERAANYRVFKIDATGMVSLRGSTCTTPTECARPTTWGGMVADAAGNLFVTVADVHNLTTGAVTPRPAILKIPDWGAGQAQGFAGSTVVGCADGPQGTFDQPVGLASGSDGYLYVADAVCGVRRVATDGQVSTVSSLGALGIAVRAEASGDLLFVSRANNTLDAVDARTGAATHLAGDPDVTFDNHHRDGPLLKAKFWQPKGLTMDAKGSLYVLDALNNRVRVVYP